MSGSPFRRHRIKAVEMLLVIFGSIREDHVVYGDAVIEPALFVEVRYFRSGIGRFLFTYLCESAAVPHRFQ